MYKIVTLIVLILFIIFISQQKIYRYIKNLV